MISWFFYNFFAILKSCEPSVSSAFYENFPSQDLPVLKADGLHGEYKMLADYNDTVLAGRQTQYGIQFITWDWSYKHTGVTQGHYWNGDYQTAKQDFAVRSGLVKRALIFKDKQLTEMYRCIQDALHQDFNLTREQRHLLGDTQEQISDLLPELSKNPNQLHELEETDFLAQHYNRNDKVPWFSLESYGAFFRSGRTANETNEISA